MGAKILFIANFFLTLSATSLIFWPDLTTIFAGIGEKEPKVWFNYVRAIQFCLLRHRTAEEYQKRTPFCKTLFDMWMEVTPFCRDFSNNVVTRWANSSQMFRF